MRELFKENLVLSVLPLLKWPLIIITLYLVFPKSIGNDLSYFIKENNIKKLEATTGGVSVEVDTSKTIQNIERAKEIKRLINSVNSEKELKNQSNDVDNILKKVAEKSDEIIKTSLSAFAKNKERNFVVGDVMNSIAEFQYIMEKNGEYDIVLKVFIDKFPYSKTFNLCSKEGRYKFLRNIKTYKSGEPAQITYIDETVNCQSSIEIAPLRDGEFLYSYDFNILDGYNIVKVQGFDTLLPQTMNRLRGNVIYTPNSDKTVYSQLEKNKLVERDFVSIKTF